MENNTDSRKIVLEMLNATISGGRFSNAVMEDAFAKYRPDPQKRSFISRLYLGTLERYVYLEYVVNLYSKTKTSKMKPVIRNILAMSTEQMLFMDSVPDFAAVNEAVTLARGCGFAGLAPFVNGVLRTVGRSFKKEDEEKKMPVWARLSVPEWIYSEAADEFGAKAAAAFFEAALSGDGGIPVRVNLNGIIPELRGERIREVEKMLEASGCSVRQAAPSDCLRIKGAGNIRSLAAWKAGLITAQNPSSVSSVMEGVRLLGKIKDNPFIIDVCAAPGGKSMIAAQEFPAGRVLARDISEEKTDLIKENISRLGIENIETQVFDARVQDESLKGCADMVIADLPCSGLGVTGEKPDIKLRVKPGDVKELAGLQREILAVCADYVKPGGLLLYSTCTFTKEENEKNKKWIQQELPFKCLREKPLLPSNGDSGFYTAVFRKKNAD